MRRLGPLLLLSVLCVTGCDTLPGEDADYPGPRNWPLVPLARAKAPYESEQRINVIAYVGVKRECPSGRDCNGPDGLELSETFYRGEIDWDLSISVNARVRHFDVGKMYVFSLVVSPPHSIELVGYETVRRYVQ